MDTVQNLLPYLVVAAVVIAIVVFRTYGWSKVSPVTRGLVCPRCDQLALEITHQMKIDDDAWDEAALQAARCTSCGFTAAATYEESRRGRANSEVVHHTGIAMDETTYDDLASALDAENAEKGRELIKTAHDAGTPFQIEFRVDRRKTAGT